MANGRWLMRDGELTIEYLHEGKVDEYPVAEEDYPYFYASAEISHTRILRTESTSKKIYDGDIPVVKMVVRKPSDVRDIRERWKRSYEADIPYLRRLSIDGKIKPEVKRRAYYDIECDGEMDWSDMKSFKVLSISMIDEDGKEYWRRRGKSEAELIDWFVDVIAESRTDMLVGWNNVQFDLEVLRARSKATRSKKGERLFRLIPNVDAMWEYQRTEHPPRMGLDYVAKREGLGAKIEVEVDKTKLADLPDDKLREYNMEDSRLVKAIDEKYGHSDLRMALTSLTGIFPHEQSAMRMIDALVLREAKRIGVVLPNSGSGETTVKKTGAMILQPRPGITENVGVFDFTGLYPTIMLNEKYGPKILRDILTDGIRRRNEWKTQWKKDRTKRAKLMSDSYKIVNNAVIGILGNPYFRLGDAEAFNQVTTRGQSLIMTAKRWFSRRGYNVVYGDTDSVFVAMRELSLDEIIEIGKELNDDLSPFTIKFEKLYSGVLFVGGVKKRYVGREIWHEGASVDELAFTGLEYVRSDWCDLAKSVQYHLAEMILREGKTRPECMAYLKSIHEDMRAGKYDDGLVLSKGIDRKKEYKTSLPHVRAWMMLEAKGIQFEGNRVEYVWAKGGDVYPTKLEDWRDRIDRGRYWEGQVKSSAMRLVDSAMNPNATLEMW